MIWDFSWISKSVNTKQAPQYQKKVCFYLTIKPYFISSGLIMGGAGYNNSSFLKILLVILSSFVELPVVGVKPFVELTLWTGWASEPCTAAHNEPLLTVQIWAYCPVGWVKVRDKEVAISWAFQFENLWKQRCLKMYQWVIIRCLLPACPHWPARCSCTPPHTALEPPWLLHSGWL